MKLHYWLAVAVLIALLAWLAHAIFEAREAARHTSCRGRMCKLQLALRNYESEHGTLPPAYLAGPDGKPWHSWRVLILPYFEEKDVFSRYRFDEPWNGPNNRLLVDQITVEIFQCPSGLDYERTFNTNYVAVVGQGTAFPDDKTVRLSDIRDGLENTVLLAEIANSDIHWMEPRDLHIDSMSFDLEPRGASSLSSPHRMGPAVVFADEITAYRLQKPLQAETLRALLTIAGNEPITRQSLMHPERSFVLSEK